MADPDQAVAVVGAGAIGGLMAAELHAAGNRVTLCARRPLARLVVERDRDRRDLPVTRSVDGDALGIATSPDEVAAMPWVVVALKAQDSAGAGPWLAELVGEDTTVVVLQNGVEHRERVGPHTRGAPLIPGITNTAVERTAPGVLRHRAGDEVTLADGPQAPAFARLFEGSARKAKVESDFTTAVWRKLLGNLAANPLTTLTNRRMEVFDEEGIRRLALGLLREALPVAQAEGARLDRDEPQRTLAGYDRLPGEGGSSMLFDRIAGRRLESDALTGAVVRAAHRHDLAVPLNEAVLALLKGLDATGRSDRRF